MKKAVASLLVLFMITLLSLVGRAGESSSVDGSSIDQNAARAVSDAMIQAIIKGDARQIVAKMERAYREQVGIGQTKAILDSVFSWSGRLLECEYKASEVGYRIYGDGQRKPLRKFWYATTTTKAAKGTYFIFVEVVPDGKQLACASFQIVTFPGGVPDEFK